MRGAIIGSGVIHAVFLAALFIFRITSPAVIAGADVVRVALVEPEASPTLRAVAPPPKPKEEPKAIKLDPTDETGVKVAPKKPSKKEPPKKQETPPPVEPPRVENVLPFASLGQPGLRGQVSADGGNFEFTYYLLLVRNRVAAGWSPPAGLVTRGQPIRVVVYFRIARNGTVLAPTIEESSGIEFFDRSALRAVKISDPLPPLPVGFSGSDLGIHFGFEFTAP